MNKPSKKDKWHGLSINYSHPLSSSWASIIIYWIVFAKRCKNWKAKD
jgi:hypothetical protein